MLTIQNLFLTLPSKEHQFFQDIVDYYKKRYQRHASSLLNIVKQIRI